MAKKLKLDLSGEGIKKLAIEHCEKLVFGICALILLMLAYWGYKKPVFDDSQNNPNSLIAKADQSQARINSTTWENSSNEELSFAKYRVADNEVPQKVEKLNLVTLDPTKYPTFPPGEISLSVKPKRTNPEIFGATDIQAKFAYQLIALNPGVVGGSSKINDSMFAPQPKKASPKKRKKKKKKQNSGQSSYQGGMSGSGSEEEGQQSPGSGGSGAGVPSSGGGGGNDTESGKISGGEKPDGPIHEPPPVMLSELEGFPLDGMIAPAAGNDRNPTFPSVMRRQIVCVTAQVPYKKQVEAYEKALRGTRRYDPEMDIPKYIGLVVSRRINGGEWVDVSEEIKSFSKRARTVMYPNLVKAENYDAFLNSQIPAFLMGDFDDFVMHPKSELRDFLAVEETDSGSTSEEKSSSASGSFEDFNSSGEASSGMEPGMEEETVVQEFVTSETAAETKQVRFFDLLANNSIKPGDKLEYRVSVVLSHPNLPLSFVTGVETAGSKRSGGAASGAGGGDSMSNEETRGGLMGSGGGATPGSGMGGGAGMAPGDSGMTGGAASGMSGMNGMNGGEAAEVVINRSDELELEMLGNPNISDADLDGAIRPDILKFKDMKPARITDPGLEKKYGLVSKESDVSNAVVFTSANERFVGGGSPPLTIRSASSVKFFDSEPVGDLVYFSYDRSLNLPVPGRAKVSAGSPVIFDAMAEVFNPLDWSIRWIGPQALDKDGLPVPKKRGNYRFRSGAIVLDVKPSKTLDNVSGLKQEFLTPAEVLVFDGKGGFTLRNELEDIKDYRHATFAGGQLAEPSDDIGGFGSGDRGGLTGGGGANPGGSGSFPGFGN